MRAFASRPWTDRACLFAAADAVTVMPGCLRVWGGGVMAGGCGEWWLRRPGADRPDLAGLCEDVQELAVQALPLRTGLVSAGNKKPPQGAVLLSLQSGGSRG